ncbi:hypothetical protein Nepgr_000091 [Nepenthes gracilis]|uniref:Dof zinc finger protein n=1 Tax=Nepenthes gracilis TaxID=150966 RepID=A0AAD3P5V9_NEPGR|nr:hypothetical protein Nepgr_000091 [Nepenthes gracilis]
MVFSSFPLYLDPPNWQQQGGGENHDNPHLHLPVPPPHVGAVGGGTTTTSRPNSMAERARLANIPLPEAPLKCPRCESTNTKFCYFNNYSLSQPRHFCKTCRRYWTRDGTLRNVPVGGGCRRNTKRSKTGRLKCPMASTATDQRQQKGAPATSGAVFSSNELIGGHFLQPNPQFPFIGSPQNLTQLGIGNLGLNLEGIQSQVADFSGAAAQQLPFLGDGFEALSATGLDSNPIHNGTVDGASPTSYGAVSYQNNLQINLRSKDSTTEVSSQLAPVKMEEIHHGLNTNKHLAGMPENNQFWDSAGHSTLWKDLSGLNTFFY